MKLAVVEQESEALQRALVAWPRRISSRLAVVELLRAVRRRDVSREALARELLARMSLVSISDRVLLAAAQLGPVGIRSLDAIHIATALRFGESLAAFVSYDARQLDAAATAGLPCVSPR